MLSQKEVIFGFALILAAICTINGAIINQNVDRTIDLSTNLVKEYLEITAEETSARPLKEYKFVIPSSEREKLAYISAKDGGKGDIKIRETKENGDTHYTLLLKSSSAVQKVYVNLIYSKSIIPNPDKIKQHEKQLVKYTGQLYFLTPYKTTKQKTLVKLSSSNIVVHTQLKPFTVSSNKIEYGPYRDIEPNTNQTLLVHYENHSPFMTVTHLDRTIEVSHWGNIAVSEKIFLEHTGAKLKGSFSRYEFQKDGRSGQAAVKSYKTILPASTTGIYYRDSNGNISTSNVNVLHDSVEVELRPRFPLFGGWKTNYILGYNVPSFEYLFNSNDNFWLKMRLIDHIYDDMIIDEAVITVILPEGSTDIELKTPYPVHRKPDQLFFTYLDTVGRPTISFSKKNLVENHMSDFDLKYKFATVSLLREPLLIITFIFVMFIATIVMLRLDCSITKHSHSHPHAHKD